MKRCLCCYKPLTEGEIDYHSKCAQRFFQSKTIPSLPYTRSDINRLAKIVVRSRTTVTGVQEKLSIDIEHDRQGNAQRLTIVGVFGRFILKPQTALFTALPEIEDLTMHLAEIAHISTVPHALIRFADGELNYITRRIDRTTEGAKLAMEDMCQLAERQTEQKYQGSYELVASLISHFSSMPRLDIVNYWEQVVFSWIVGNADMHLKNFSLLSTDPGIYRLSPTYDQVSTAIVMPEDTEELAMSLQGFKKKLMRFDFIYAMESSGISEKVANRLLTHFQQFKDQWFECIDSSFVTDEQKTLFKELITERLGRLREE